jgi:flavin-dependent dehydrogenase
VSPVQRDLIVCGAGSAGAALAGMAAARGMRVLVLERKTLDRAGASWVNDVPGWMFDDAGIARPTGDELHRSGRLTMIAGYEPDAPRVTARPGDFVGVDMRGLVSRLQDSAMRAGAELKGGEHVRALEHREHEVVVTTSSGTYAGRFLVDASGLSGLEAMGKSHASPRDVCAAAQQVHRIRDVRAADAFFARYGAGDGDVTVFAGVAGGYSIVNVRRHDGRVFLLTGTIPADGHPSGKALLDGFVEERSWIGERLFGGARAIPLAYARPIVARGRIAALGDAASQVFSAHGSGTGAGLIAASMLADAIGRGDLADYQQRWQKRFGLSFATHDLFRRLTQSLSQEELRVMFAENILAQSAVEAALMQHLPPIDASMLRTGRALWRHPSLARKFARLGARVARLAALYARPPRETDAQDRWAARVHAAMT